MTCNLQNAVERAMFCKDLGPFQGPELMPVNVEHNHVPAHLGDRNQGDDDVVRESE